MLKTKYRTEFNLNHNEAPAKINLETGEVKALNKRPNNLPKGKIVFQKDSIFKKEYPNGWKFLAKYLTPVEYMIAHRLGAMAKANTNSLEPLDDNTTMVQLMEIFEVSKNVINPILKKLHSLGVYGKFDVVREDKPYTKFWVFNPFLLFSGKTTDDSIAALFEGTRCERAHHDPNYELSLEVIKELKLKKPKIKKNDTMDVVLDKLGWD